MIELDQHLPKVINVVGNAQSLLSKKYGTMIDKHPTIRFNRIEIIKEASQGSRWDYLASSEVKTFEKYNNTTPQFHTLIFTPYYDIHLSHLTHVKFKVKILELELDLSNELIDYLGSRPSTGTQILYLLDKLKRQVNLFGFDWKFTPTIYDPLRKKDPHDYIKEEEFVKSLIVKNNWKLYT